MKMTLNEALHRLAIIREQCPDLNIKVITVDDVLTANDWPDTTANREHVRESYEFSKWDEMAESDWDRFAWMDDAPDTKG